MDICEHSDTTECKECRGGFCAACFPNHACIRTRRVARFRIVSVNDVYTVEGFAKVHQLVNKKRAGRNSMFCVNGDFLGGSALAVRTQGHALIAILNAMKVDNVVIGNHEFDYSAEGLTSCMKKSAFRWFGSNIINTGDGSIFAGVTDTHVFTVPFEDGFPGGVKVGMFGVCTAATPSLSYPGPTVRFQDVVSTAQACVKKLRAQGAKVIIALTHVSMLQDREIAKHVDGLSLLLGGHDHTPFAATEGNALILKFGQNGEHLGIVDLDMTWDPQRADSGFSLSRSFKMLSTANVEPAREILHVAETFNGTAEDAIANQEELVILKHPLSSLTIEGRQTGCSFGYVIADAFVEYHKADLGLINGGFMRGDRQYPARTVLTVGMIREELPFPREVVLLSIKGKDLLQAVEEELSYLPALSGSFPHVSAGWTLHYDPAKPVGSRVESLECRGVSLDPERMLAVALTGFMATGGDKCVSFTKGTIISQPNPMTAGNVVIMYLRALRDSVPSAGSNRSQLYELDVPVPRMFATKFVPTLIDDGPIQVTRVNSSPPSSLPVSSVVMTVPTSSETMSQSLSPHPTSHLHSSVSHPDFTTLPAFTSHPSPRTAERAASPTRDLTINVANDRETQKFSASSPSAHLPSPVPLKPAASYSVPAVTAFYLSPLSSMLPEASDSPSSFHSEPPSPFPSPAETPNGAESNFPPDDNQFRHGLTNACTHLAVMGAKWLHRAGDLSKNDLSLMFVECKNPSVHGQMSEILEGDRSLEILTEGFPGSGFMSSTNVEWSEKGLQQIFAELTRQKGTVSCPVTFGGYTLCLHRVEWAGKVTYFLVDTHNVDQKGSLILKSPTPDPLLQHLRAALPKHGGLGLHATTAEYCVFRVRDMITHTLSPPAPKRPALSAPPTAQAMPNKVCPSCTFENTGARTVCAMCETKL